MNVKVYFFLLQVMFAAVVNDAKAGALILEGKYQSKNIYVINQESDAGVGFNVYEVRVNGMISVDEINNYAFEIDLEQFAFTKGEAVLIEIKFKNVIAPKILNPYALTPIPTFEISEIYFDPQHVLHWVSLKENEELQFLIQQFKWNKWITIGKVSGKGGSDKNKYAFKPLLISGLNKLRVAQIGHNEVLKASPEVTVTLKLPEIYCDLISEMNKIIFSNKTCFEVHDFLGNLKKRGFDQTVDISNLNRGKYYLSYDNQTKIIVIEP